MACFGRLCWSRRWTGEAWRCCRARDVGGFVCGNRSKWKSAQRHQAVQRTCSRREPMTARAALHQTAVSTPGRRSRVAHQAIPSPVDPAVNSRAPTVRRPARPPAPTPIGDSGPENTTAPGGIGIIGVRCHGAQTGEDSENIGGATDGRSA
jgi:hypothetical protein